MEAREAQTGKEEKVNKGIHYGDTIVGNRDLILLDLLKYRQMPLRIVQQDRREGHLPTGPHAPLIMGYPGAREFSLGRKQRS